jgi:glycosyltransferase involved in cell wall biosynthesis
VWRLVYQIEGPRIARYERWVADTFEETWLISPAGYRALQEVCPQANLQVVPNGVDLDRFYPTGETPEPDSLVFVGHFQVFHNIDAAVYLAREILPRVRAQLSTCKLWIVGADPSPTVQQLAADPAVTVTGFVPDLNAYLNRAAVFVAPLRFAAGVQNKVLEAMAAGRPVVTSGIVNAGLGAEPGRDLLVADEPDEIAGSMLKLLSDKPLRVDIGRAARAFIQRRYTWQHVVRRARAIEAHLELS